MPTEPAATGPTLAELRRQCDEGLHAAELAFLGYQKELADREKHMGNEEAAREREREKLERDTPRKPDPAASGEDAERAAAAAKIQAIQRGRQTRAKQGKTAAGPGAEVLQAAYAALQPGGAAWVGNVDTDAVLRACGDMLQKLSGAAPPGSESSVTELRQLLIASRDLGTRWRELFPKEPDGSIRLPGGDFLRFDGKLGKLTCGDFDPFLVQEDEYGCTVTFCGSGDGDHILLREDEDGDPTEVNWESIQLAQPFARSVLQRMGLASQDGSGDDREWEELMRWLGAEHLSILMKLK